MEEPRKITFSIQEDPEIVRLIDQRAEEEGTSRSAIIRRAIRLHIFSLPKVPTSGNIPDEQAAEQAA